MARAARTWPWLLAGLASIGMLALVVVREAPAIGGDLVDIVPIGDGTAALAYAEGVELVRDDGAVQWRAPALRYPVSSAEHTSLPYLVADGERVYARAHTERGPALVALSAAQGRELWRSEPFAEASQAHGRAHDRVARTLAGPVVVDVFRDGDGDDHGSVLLAASDRASGELRWRARLGPESHGPLWVRGERIIFGAQGVLHVFRASDGEPVGLVEAAKPICVLDDQLIYAQGHLGVVASLDGATMAHLPIAEALPELDPRAPVLRACGRRDDSFVLAVEAVGKTELVSLRGPLPEHDGGFELRWRLSLGDAKLPPAGRADDVASRHPERATLAGELPRYLPIKLGRDELVMLDLDGGEIAWRATIAGRYQYRLYAVGDDALFVDPAEGLAMSLGGDTGRAVSAARIGGAEISAHHLDAGALWSFFGEAWAVIDARTLRPRPPHDAPWVKPVSLEAIADELGLPLGD